MDRHLRRAIDHLPQGVQVISSNWRYLYVNDAAARHARLTAAAMIGKRLQDCAAAKEPTELLAAFARVMTAREPEKLRHLWPSADGDRHLLELSIEPVPGGICVVSRDVTDEMHTQEHLRSMQTQLQQGQKMEALGRLAGGVAHDFNNQLTVILGFTQMLLEQHADDALARDLKEIEAAAQRSAALIRQLLAFGKRQVLHIEPVSLPQLLRDVTRLIFRLLGEDVSCDLRIDPDTEPILADASQLEHVITNLAVNARDSMPSGGHLTISTTTTTIRDGDALQHPAMKVGRYTMLSVADTGHGMDEPTQARIFEPFFTTKEPGKGTGLGLSMVYGIVKQMGGFIWVYSQVGRGTTFRLYFPVTGQRAERLSPRHAAEHTASEGGRRILVVEDDRGVREFVVRSLRERGYEVVATASAEEARLQLREEKRAFDLLLLDVVLPGQSGPAFLDEIERRVAPSVIFMSGYSEQHVQNYRWSRSHALLEKPFTSEQLLHIVRDALRVSPAEQA